MSLKGWLPQTSPPKPSPNSKPPQYEDKSNREYFILWFEEVVKVNGQGKGKGKMVLRAAGKLQIFTEIFEALRVHFRISPRAVQTTLNTMHKKHIDVITWTCNMDQRAGWTDIHGVARGLQKPYGIRDFPQYARQCVFPTTSDSSGNSYRRGRWTSWKRIPTNSNYWN